MGCGPDKVVVGEVDGRPFVICVGTGTEHSILRHTKVQDNLLVTSPVSAVRENKDSLDPNVSEVPGARALKFLGGQFAERRSVILVLDDIPGRNNVLEAIALSDLPTFFTFSANNEY